MNRIEGLQDSPNYTQITWEMKLLTKALMSQQDHEEVGRSNRLESPAKSNREEIVDLNGIRIETSGGTYKAMELKMPLLG